MKTSESLPERVPPVSFKGRLAGAVGTGKQRSRDRQPRPRHFFPGSDSFRPWVLILCTAGMALAGMQVLNSLSESRNHRRAAAPEKKKPGRGEPKITVAGPASFVFTENTPRAGTAGNAPEKTGAEAGENVKDADAPHPRPTPKPAETVGAEKDKAGEGKKPTPPTKGGKGKPAPKKEGTKEEGEARKPLTPEVTALGQFFPPLKEFAPLEKLDPESKEFKEIFSVVADNDLQTRAGRVEAKNLELLKEPIQYLFRFLRTKTPKELEVWRKEYTKKLGQKLGGRALARPTWNNVRLKPQNYRGAPLHFRGLLIRKYEMRYWRLWNGEKHAGVPSAKIFFCRGPRNKYYAVLAPTEGKNLISTEDWDNADIVEWTGLFLSLWPYELRDDPDKKPFMPLYVAWSIKKATTPAAGSSVWVYVLVLLGALAVLALAFYLKAENDEGEKKMRELRTRRAQRRRKRQPGGRHGSDEKAAAEKREGKDASKEAAEEQEGGRSPDNEKTRPEEQGNSADN